MTPSNEIKAYVSRIRNLVTDMSPLQVLENTVSTLRKLTYGLSAARLTEQPAPEKWSIAGIVAHLSDSETATRFRFRQLLSQPDGSAISAYNQDAWALVCRNGQIPFEDSMRLFSALRDSNLRLWKSLAAEQLTKFGYHEERGRETVQDLLILVAGHDVNHLNQVQAIASATKDSAGVR
jgi:hypothetical protein